MALQRILSLALVGSFAVALSSAGCSAEEVAEEAPEVIGSADSIAPFDDPGHLLGSVSRRLADNITAADIGQTFGAPDGLVPYPDTYWPMNKDGINVRWRSGAASPLEKYMAVADPSNLARAQRWNSDHAGKDVPGVASWFGICNGWAGAASTEAPMRHPVLAKLEGDDVVTCREGEPGCTKFEIGDLNALMATVYADAESRFVGARCDTAPKNILRDGNGRIDRTANGAGCKGLNPGSMLIVLGHRLKRDRTPMVIDAQTDSNTDQIWNQPAYRYKVHRFETLSETEATNYVRRGKRRAGLFGRNRNRDYKWNDAAKGFALVDVEVIWVTEQGPNTSFVSGLQSSKSTRMTSIIELDRDANDPAAEIIGGELLEDGTAETSRLINNPFVWLATGPGPESSTEHNPFVKTSVVRQLMALGRE